MHQFDSFCREAIRRGVGNAFRVAENRRKRHILLDDLDETSSELVSADEYPSTYEVYRVMDQEIALVLQIPRRTVNYQRNVALQQLNQIMTER